MKQQEQWICKLKELDIPFIVNSEQEARELLEKWNISKLENEGMVSKTTTENFSVGDQEIDITCMYLTWGNYDEEDPYGSAYKYDYDHILKYTTEVKPEIDKKIVKCFNPLFAEDMKYDKIFYALRIKYNTPESKPIPNSISDIAQVYTGTSSPGRISVQILKEVSNKNEIIRDQYDIFNWLFDNIPIIEKDLYDTEYANITSSSALSSIIVQEANYIASCSRRGPANCIVTSKNIINRISPFIENETTPTTLYVSDDFEFVGFFNKIPVYKCLVNDVIPDDAIVMSYSNHAIDKGCFLLHDKKDGCYYLNKIENSANYLGNYKDFFRILKIKH